MLRCPDCQSILGDVKQSKEFDAIGELLVKIKCDNCKGYKNVSIIEYKEQK
ncbi:putative transcription factor [Bacillus phage Bolokhovo]|uniref:Putative transcription factor n=1 Tax=Bacillus phage Bolokhovo TaxID=2743970 RepID=A0A7D7KHH1_9CAUD|nr:putative transcription factor [Bacillus phage Bolokhovo]